MDPSSSRHHDHHHIHPTTTHPHPYQHFHYRNHVLCNNSPHHSVQNSVTLPTNGYLASTNGSLANSLPRQLSQSCNGQQYPPLLALQQNFSHLLPSGFPETHQIHGHQNQSQHATSHRNLHHQRDTSQSHHPHIHHHHHDHNLTHHHQRNHYNWRKSKLQTNPKSIGAAPDGAPHSLLDLSAKIVAEHIPFQSVELRYERIPEPVQRRIIFWSFPRHEDDIKMYSSLSSDSAGNSGVNSSVSGASNGSTQPPNSTYAWVDHPHIQANNAPQTSNHVVSQMKTQNQKHQLTFYKGLRLYDEGCVHDVLQVGFNLSGLVNVKINPTNLNPSSNSKIRGNNFANTNTVHGQNNQGNNEASNSHNQLGDANNTSGEPASTKTHRVSVTFDRCKITSVSCSCALQDIFWCEHVVALILYRIRNPETIDLRVPISETLLSLDRQQLQKLVQYIIAEHHTEVLPTAQRLLDEMHQSYSEINQIQGAPDPTAGASAEDEHIWHLDECQANEKVQNYLNSVCNNKEGSKQINALFLKIREMLRAKDTNGTRLLKLITEQFLISATRNDKSRMLWDQLVSLWVVVMINPDLSTQDKRTFAQLLNGWSRVPRCPKEDVERRVSIKRKAAELSDDEDSDDCTSHTHCAEYALAMNQSSNNYPAHMATHRRSYQSNNTFPLLRPFNQVPLSSPSCPCQLAHPAPKKLKGNLMSSNGNTNNSTSRATSSNQHAGRGSSQPPRLNENRLIINQEPRSVFHRALDVLDSSWDDPHLQLILKRDGPVDFEPNRSQHFDYTGNPLWDEPISQSAARIETLKSHGYNEQALRLAVATVRRLKLQQDHWCLAPESDADIFNEVDIYAEAWIGHPFDPINVLMDIMLEASLSEVDSISGSNNPGGNLCALNTASRCSCPYNQALVDFTHRLLPDLASFSYQHRVEGFPILPLVNLASRRTPISQNHTTSDKTPYFHVPVPGCCQKDSYLKLAVELALIALGQQRAIPSIPTAHDRAIRQESDVISKLQSIDTSDPLLLEILKHQTTVLLEGGPFQNTCCGITSDSAPLHTFAKYLFDALVTHHPQLAYKVGVYALKIPLVADENMENFGAARTSPRSNSQSHLQNEQLALAQTMLSRAKSENQQEGYLRKVYRASVKNIRNPPYLLKLAKHAQKEAKPNGTTTVYPALLKTSFELGLQVLKLTATIPSSGGNSKRKDAIQFIVECATDMGLESVLLVMRDAREHFSALEALNLVVSRDNDGVNLRAQAFSKLKPKENPSRDLELNRRSMELALECAARDPAQCALDALKFCQQDSESLDKALKIIMEAGTNGSVNSTLLIQVADHISSEMKGMDEKAFDLAMVAISSLSIPSNSDNSTSKKDILSACDYAKKVNRFSTLIPKLINNIECATVLSEIYHKFGPSHHSSRAITPNQPIIPPFSSHIYNMANNMGYKASYGKHCYDLMTQVFNLEDARWWDALLKRTMRAFVDTTRNRLQNISPRHYNEFIEFLAKAQGIFDKATDGPQQFKDLIAEIIKSYRTKKKLMEQLKDRFEPTFIQSKT